jgi:hypothetical protein
MLDDTSSVSSTIKLMWYGIDDGVYYAIGQQFKLIKSMVSSSRKYSNDIFLEKYINRI